MINRYNVIRFPPVFFALPHDGRNLATCLQIGMLLSFCSETFNFLAQAEIKTGSHTVDYSSCAQLLTNRDVHGSVSGVFGWNWNRTRMF